MTTITYPTWIDLPDDKAIVIDGETVMRVDLRPNAFCPAEARFPDAAKRLLFILLLSPELLGTTGETSAARRALWIFDLSEEAAFRIILRLRPLVGDTKHLT